MVFTISKVTIPTGRKNDGKVIISNVEKFGILAKTEIYTNLTSSRHDFDIDPTQIRHRLTRISPRVCDSGINVHVQNDTVL